MEDFILTKFRYNWLKIVDFLIKAHFSRVRFSRVGQKVPKLMQTKAGEMVSSYDYLSQLDCIRHPIGVTAFYSEALLVYVVKNSSCM